jgi:hypothetical protein
MDTPMLRCEWLPHGTRCVDRLTCCDCGDPTGDGCGCRYCWSCNACDFCKNAEN